MGKETVSAHLDRIDRVHCNRVSIQPRESIPHRGARKDSGNDLLAQCSAMPAKAPAVMFCNNEKLGGSDS